MIKKFSVVLLAVVFAVSCKEEEKAPPEPECHEWVDSEWSQSFCVLNGNDTMKVYTASVYALLSNPKFFDNKIVYTCGYLSAGYSIESGNIEYSLNPHEGKQSFTNMLFIEKLENDEYKGMRIPAGGYEVDFGGGYTCLHGVYSKNVGLGRATMLGFSSAKANKFPDEIKKRVELFMSSAIEKRR